MSRIGKKPISIPSGVTVTLEDKTVKVKGSKGELSFETSYEVEVEVDEKEITVKKTGKTKAAPALWGTTRASIKNLITGVSEGFKKGLELHGVGYKMTLQGKKLVLNLGFSHPIEVQVPEDLTIAIDGNVMNIEGIDKQRVGQFAAEIRAFRKIEPYKGKGLRYVGERFIKKEGKRAVGAE
ncbi:50S ribosomal protein L6 [bacterium]|jgi:large subunit ribosomal protein L6|nr:50S ribosomal protein L6 [bacterium]MBT4597813.1 50S ribosomal protein L6 [bacterium]MBT6753537.1 50S ribosomal protein L6 [bacterium]MBT7037735.1 50S ribosomal protein L6 [bacterium]MBT7431984.1 50S ribosomal protein L6 [bacterium]